MEINPFYANLAALAASANSAIGLYQHGSRSENVTRGLDQGVEFCKTLIQGYDEYESTSGRFSAASLHLSLGVRGMLESELSSPLVLRARELSGDLEKLRERVRKGEPLSEDDALVGRVKGYFFDASVILPRDHTLRYGGKLIVSFER